MNRELCRNALWKDNWDNYPFISLIELYNSSCELNSTNIRNLTQKRFFEQCRKRNINIKEKYAINIPIEFNGEKKKIKENILTLL